MKKVIIREVTVTSPLAKSREATTGELYVTVLNSPGKGGGLTVKEMKERMSVIDKIEACFSKEDDERTILKPYVVLKNREFDTLKDCYENMQWAMFSPQFAEVYDELEESEDYKDEKPEEGQPEEE